MKQKILSIYETIWDEISQKTKIFLYQEKLCGIPSTFIKFCKIVFPNFIYFHKSYRNSANIRQHLTVFPSDFNNIYLKYFIILQNLTWNYKILLKFMIVNESYDIPWYFLSQITHIRFVSINCNGLLAFHDFVPWQTKFFCLLSYCFAFGQHRQIFCHHQTKSNFSNIADTYEPFEHDYSCPNHIKLQNQDIKLGAIYLALHFLHNIRTAPIS